MFWFMTEEAILLESYGMYLIQSPGSDSKIWQQDQYIPKLLVDQHQLMF